MNDDLKKLIKNTSFAYHTMLVAKKAKHFNVLYIAMHTLVKCNIAYFKSQNVTEDHWDEVFANTKKELENYARERNTPKTRVDSDSSPVPHSIDRETG